MGKSLRLVRLAVAVAGCLALLVFPAGAGAAGGSVTTPYSDVLENTCNGETVAVTGESHVVYVVNDNKLEIKINWPDTSGVALGTGTLYQANDATHDLLFSITGNRFTVGFQDSFELVSLDKTSNLLVHVSVDMTIDLSTGDVTERMRGGLDCSGQTSP
jgi:hypothetical protein